MATLKQELLNLGNQKGETKIRTPDHLPRKATALPLHHHRSPQEKERDWSKNYDTFFHTLNAHLQKYKQGADQLWAISWSVILELACIIMLRPI